MMLMLRRKGECGPSRPSVEKASQLDRDVFGLMSALRKTPKSLTSLGNKRLRSIIGVKIDHCRKHPGNTFLCSRFRHRLTTAMLKLLPRSPNDIRNLFNRLDRADV